MDKQAMIRARQTAANDLGLDKPQQQAAHLLLVVRETKKLHAEHDGDWGKVFSGLVAIGFGFGMNASQFNQHLDKEPKSGGKSLDISDLEV
jgi:hypothetical protein